MAFDPTYNLQLAINTALTTSNAVMSIAKAVVDFVPENAEPPYPYIVIGEDQPIPDEYVNAVTSTVHSTIHLWSIYRGKSEIKRLASAVIGVLGQRLNITNVVCFSGKWVSTKDIGDPVNGTQHLVLEFEYRLGGPPTNLT